MEIQRIGTQLVKYPSKKIKMLGAQALKKIQSLKENFAIFRKKNVLLATATELRIARIKPIFVSINLYYFIQKLKFFILKLIIKEFTIDIIFFIKCMNLICKLNIYQIHSDIKAILINIFFTSLTQSFIN